MTQEQTKEMQRVFPQGWEENDIPAFWRKEDLANELSQIETDKRIANKTEKEESVEDWAEMHCSQDENGEWQC